MIDSIIYYDAASKVGTKLTALADINVGKVARFIAKTEGGDDFDLSCVTPIKIITKQAVVDAEGNVTSPTEYAPGYGFLVATDDVETAAALWALPNNICRLQLDRETGKVLRRRISLALLRTLLVEPMFAGCNYAFASITE